MFVLVDNSIIVLYNLYCMSFFNIWGFFLIKLSNKIIKI